ncbi:hypothetical protein R1flu_002843 [Riccia fluitans]|uniref:NAC domain-containing protein n=1 Tax=Riccia fluitans TaxID=41844 RepID=A0ABD1Y7H6_9MARC
MESVRSKEEAAEKLQTPGSDWTEMALPGFRFHPTEEELVGYYLRRMVQGRQNSVELIASLDLYQYDPWELPAMAFMGEKEWFFFCPRDKKYPNGARPNRVTASGYWKATGTDRPVRCSGDSRCIGLKKTLVFYTGRAPRGNKTEWIMNEYRMPKPAERSISVMTSGLNSINYSFSNNDNFLIKNDVALCRIYRKSSSTFNSFSFLSAINARDLEERTCRMMVSRFENNQVQQAVVSASNIQQQEHHVLQRLQVQTPLATGMPMTSSTPAEPSPNDRINVHLQQPTTMTTAGLVRHDTSQLVGRGMETAEEQQQKLDNEAVQRAFDHGVGPSIVSCTTTSEEASRQLQIALRTAMAKLDGMGGVALAQDVNEGESAEINGSGIFARLRNQKEDAVDCPTTSRRVHVIRNSSPKSTHAAMNQDHGDRMSPLTAHHHHPEDFSHPLVTFCSRDLPSPTSLLRKSSNFEATPACVTTAAALNSFKRDLSCCSSPRISIPSSFSQHHENSSPATGTEISTTTAPCSRYTITTPRLDCDSAMGATAAVLLSMNRNNRPNSSSHISTSTLTQMELEDDHALMDDRTMPPPLVAQYWRQSSCAASSPAAASAGAAGVASISQLLNPFDALSGFN